jgi:hypothetical protein
VRSFSRSIFVILFSIVLAAHDFAQESVDIATGAITLLSELLAEAKKNNPQIEAARQGWQATWCRYCWAEKDTPYWRKLDLTTIFA